MSKKGSDWLQGFPVHLQERIKKSIENFPINDEEDFDPMEKEYDSASLFLAHSFKWHSTYEERDYWLFLYELIEFKERSESPGITMVF